ncbi:MAG TPA: hypothetical protein VM574_07960 [Terrimicrobiaceae bacterium]|jgi:hypothetical protein|nr:hypothetical protein [Terrimicrobiaceae bacterium]
MIATITKLLEQKYGNGAEYVRVTFAVAESIGEKTRWAKTDLCPTYRNWHYWKDRLEVGAQFIVRMKDDTTVDADWRPKYLGQKPPPPPDPQLGLFP